MGKKSEGTHKKRRASRGGIRRTRRGKAKSNVTRLRGRFFNMNPGLRILRKSIMSDGCNCAGCSSGATGRAVQGGNA